MEMITAGEQLRINDCFRSFFALNSNIRLVNQYGPTETHVVTSHTLDGAPEKWPTLPPIGQALPHVQTEIHEGELIIKGVAVAKGYRNSARLTSERFNFSSGQRSYRTGD